MSKYQVGARLEVVDRLHGHRFDIGEMVEVISYSNDDEDYFVKGASGAGYFVTEEEMVDPCYKKGSKHKVGDVLVVVDNQSGHGFAKGELVEITVIFDDHYTATDSTGEWWAVIDEDLSPTYTDSKSDMVNSPAHYGSGRIECIEYIEDFLTTEEYIGYLRGNIAKYLHRFRYKNGLEDLKKAEWYLKRLSEIVEDEDCSKL